MQGGAPFLHLQRVAVKRLPHHVAPHALRDAQALEAQRHGLRHWGVKQARSEERGAWAQERRGRDARLPRQFDSQQQFNTLPTSASGNAAACEVDASLLYSDAASGTPLSSQPAPRLTCRPMGLRPDTGSCTGGGTRAAGGASPRERRCRICEVSEGLSISTKQQRSRRQTGA